MTKEEKKSSKKRLGIILMGVGAVLLIVSIGVSRFQNTPSQTESIGEQEEIFEEKLSVVTSFYPIYFLTKHIGGDAVDVYNLAGSRDVHSYEPTPKEVSTIMNADLVLYQSQYLEGWVKDMVPQLEEKNIPSQELLEVIEEEGLGIEKEEGGEADHYENGDEHTEDAHSDEYEGDEHSDEHSEDIHTEDGHNHGSLDPHTWLDPSLAIRMTQDITQTFVQIDPMRATLYEQNAQQLIERFKELDMAYEARLSECQRESVIVSHDAFGYLARRYGFTTQAIAGLSTLDQPSAQTLLSLKEEAQSGMTHILVEQNSVEDFAKTLSEETGLELAYVNPMGRGTLDEEKDFFDVMYDNLDAIASGLGCDNGVQ
jgi:zinc transport system substrate-binding protein